LDGVVSMSITNVFISEIWSFQQSVSKQWRCS